MFLIDQPFSCQLDVVCFTDQLVLTLATPCYGKDGLLGVAAVDLTTSDLLASIEYFNEGELSYAFIIENEG